MIIAIDPGLTGAIAVLDRQGAGQPSIFDMPVVARGKTAKVRHQIDPANLAHLLTGYENPVVVMEAQRPMPGQGVASVFSLGDSTGVIRGVAATLGIPLHEVQPSAWKKALKLTADKEYSRATAIRLYPAIAHLLARKKDHNRAEALLLGHYWMMLSQ